MTAPPLNPQDAIAFVVARSACRRTDRPAFWLSHFLPAEKRGPALAIVAGCRMIADAIAANTSGGGGCCSGEGGSGTARLISERIEAMYAGPLTLPRPEFRDESQHLLAAVELVSERYEIPKALWLDFIAGCASGRTIARYATWTSLRRQFESNGGSVAAMLACVLGLTHSDARRYAMDLGVATQLINVLRDFAANATRERLRLPLEDLARCGCPERELLAGAMTERVRALVRVEVERSRELLTAAGEGLCWLAGDGSRVAAAVWIELQRATLDEIERRDFNVLALPAPPVPIGRLMRRIPSAWRLARRRADDPVARTH